MTDYSKLKVADLKDLIKERGIASTGLKVKQNFVDALEADDASNGDGGDQGDDDGIDTGKSEAGAAAAVAETAEQTHTPADGVDIGATGNEVEKPQDDLKKTHKRKRRSPTPPFTEEIVNKKLKTAEEKADHSLGVKLPEDLAADAPQEKTLLLATRDNVMEVDQDEDKAGEMLDTGPPSKHPPTRALYIKELVRPLQISALRDHISSVAQLEVTDPPNEVIVTFHLDKLRSHAFVCFDSVGAASRARAALHDKIWPDEPMRKPLWVDFIPDHKVQEWIDIEVGRNDMTRWEVAYNSAGVEADSAVITDLREVENGPSSIRRPSSHGQPSRPPPPSTGQGMPNAPSGPRSRSTQLPQVPTPAAVEPPKPTQSSFDSLDQLYNFTEAKPKIYFQPVSRELAQRRQEEIDEETSRSWSEVDADPSAYSEGELRRYTFEDDYRLVDGGADFGLFGRRGRGGGPPRGGRGRGGDYYRGGNRGR